MAIERATAANESLEEVGTILQAEVDRAVVAIRAALGDMAQRQCLHPSLMGIISLLDRVEFHVTYNAGDSAFELDEHAGIVHFRSSGLDAVMSGAQIVADEVGVIGSEETAYIKQLAVNLFVAHELLHICQNFPHFPDVADIKSGIPGLGLPLLDAVADIVSASICANAEQARLGGATEEEYFRHFANTLVVSYAIGSLIFDARTKPEKRQRALGLLVSALLIQALSEGRLQRENISVAWKPTSPLLLLNVDNSGVFNALVVDEIASILFPNQGNVSKHLAIALWESVGKTPVARTLELVATLLRQAGAVK